MGPPGILVQEVLTLGASPAPCGGWTPCLHPEGRLTLSAPTQCPFQVGREQQKTCLWNKWTESALGSLSRLGGGSSQAIGH